jgi:glycosyltransferase involved in cell wall biosynthesis
MATAQQLTSLALGLSKAGHQVTVITSDRGYDDQSRRFARRENWQGFEIIRISSLALGKTARWRRALNFSSFLLACSWRLLLLPRFDRVVALTSPPLISFLGALFARIKGGKFFFWVMDLNPDEAIAAGWLRPDSLTTRILSGLLRHSLRHSERVIVLDRFMKQRVEAKGIPAARIEIISPWALDDSVSYDHKGREAFRARHSLVENFVVMYSGNHSPCHPLDTLLNAAAELAPRKDIVFCFVGGGSEQAKVKEFSVSQNLENVLCLPYQSINELSGSLSAADLHVAVMGDPFVGIVHPCKVYNILELGTPLLYIGPEESSIADVANRVVNAGQRYPFYQARHGDVATVVRSIEATVGQKHYGNAAFDLELAREFSVAKLMPRMIDLLEEGMFESELVVNAEGSNEVSTVTR